MKLDQLRKVIREEVRAAVKEELQDVMNEAVKYASTPQQPIQKASAYEPVNTTAPKQWSVEPGKRASLDEMLNQTSISMNSTDARNFVRGGGAAPRPNFASQQVNQLAGTGGDVGVQFSDIPGFDPAKAKAILDAANAKSRNRIQ